MTPKLKAHVTIADVAEKAGVSMMTVSRVVNNKDGIHEQTRQHIISVMDQLGYKPNRVARSLATNKTLKVGVVVPSISSAYFGAILEGAEQVFWDNEYHMLLSNSGFSAQRERNVLDLFEEDRVDGVLILGSYMRRQHLSQCLKSQRAAVVYNVEVDPDVAGHISVDERAAVSTALNHFMKRGRRKLAFVGGGNSTYAKRERTQGFLEMMGATGNYAPAPVVVCNEAGAYKATLQLLRDRPEIDGILCFHDEIAVRTLRACAEMGRKVPEDIAVIGYDDLDLARLVTPTLTCLRVTITAREIGALAARMLLDRVEGEILQEPVVLDHELVLRDSAP